MYCVKCGNTGIRIDGTPCDCKISTATFYGNVQCLDVPESYRDIKFSELLLPSDMGAAYANFMKSMYESIITLRWKFKNAVLCTPPQTGKSVLAYSCIQELFRKGVPVFPVYDVLEYKRILLDIDYGRQQFFGIEHPEDVYEAEYLFVVVPSMTNYDVYDIMSLLISRRTRRGLSTIFLYEGTWEQLVSNDTKGVIKGSKGNGSFCTLEVNSWNRRKTE